MLTIGKALSQYTDEILVGNDGCLDRFVEELEEGDIEEFLESAKLIYALYYQKKTSKFESIFEIVNQHKEEIYDAMPRAVDFRGKGDEDAIAQIETIFDEEFKNED